MKLPAGVRDWLPHELARKREIEQQMRAVFGRWAYEEVQSPMFERFDVLEKGLGAETTALLFQFNDRSSTALALRPEMTTPIARLVSTRMREAVLPLRLAYVAPVFRYYEQPQEGRMRELTQAGAELIGASGPTPTRKRSSWRSKRSPRSAARRAFRHQRRAHRRRRAGRDGSAR
jgi:ATP phosphoribosyltransferase regulatory subunit